MEIIMETAASVVEYLMNYSQRRAKKIERKKIKRKIKRRNSDMQAFCRNITQANRGLLDNHPAESELDKRVQEYLKDDCKAYPKRFFGKLYHDSKINMQVLGFSWDSAFLSAKKNHVSRIERALEYYFYPQDFLQAYSDLEQRGYCAVGALGFLLESMSVDSKEGFILDKPDGSKEGRVFDSKIKRGIISGRLTLSGPNGHKGEYRFDSRNQECGLEIISADKSEKFHSDSYYWSNYSKILDWINANKHDEEKWIG